MINLDRLVKRGIILCSLTLTLNACGTLTTLKDGGIVGTSTWNTEPEKIVMYQGVISDAGHILQNGEWYRLLDFPFSFAADTILLPYTIPSAFANDNEKAEQAQKQQQPQSATTSAK